MLRAINHDEVIWRGNLLIVRGTTTSSVPLEAIAQRVPDHPPLASGNSCPTQIVCNTAERFHVQYYLTYIESCQTQWMVRLATRAEGEGLGLDAESINCFQSGMSSSGICNAIWYLVLLVQWSAWLDRCLSPE